jgi:O-antigen ligase
MKYAVIQQKADRLAAWFAVALAVSIPISVALDNVLLALFLACWLLGDVPAKLRMIRANPIALVSAGLYGLLLLGTFYGDATIGQKATFMVKYKELLLVPLLIPLFTDARVRRAGGIGMTAAIAVTVVLSALIKLGWFPVLNHWYGTRDPSVGAVVFKGQIAQSYMMAVMAFFYAVLAEAASGRRRWLFGLLAAGCAGNVVLMVYGRTGYVVLAVLAFYFLASRQWRSRREVAGCLLVAGLLAGSAVLFAHHFDHRVEEAIHDAQQWRPHQAATTSNGLRLEFYDNTLALIKKRPLLGYGTGGFQNAYARQVAGTTMIATHNPHDDMLLMTAQLGIIGLATLLFFYWQYWYQAAALPQATARRMARALLLSLVVSGTVNSLLINHAESLFFGWWAAWIFSERSRLPALAGARRASAPAITETV